MSQFTDVSLIQLFGVVHFSLIELKWKYGP